jgi:hypothetical protein
MRTFCQLAIVVVSTVCLAQTVAGPITIVISAETSAVQAGEEVRINVQLTNNSTETLDASANINSMTGVDPNYRFDVRDSNGIEMPRRTYAHSEHVTGHAILRTLKPGESITDAEPLGRLVDMSRPGKYTIQVSRSLPNNGGAATVKSNKIIVTVAP